MRKWDLHIWAISRSHTAHVWCGWDSNRGSSWTFSYLTPWWLEKVTECQPSVINWSSGEDKGRRRIFRKFGCRNLSWCFCVRHALHRSLSEELSLQIQMKSCFSRRLNHALKLTPSLPETASITFVWRKDLNVKVMAISSRCVRSVVSNSLTSFLKVSKEKM